MARKMEAVNDSKRGVGVKITDPDEDDRLIAFVQVEDTPEGEARANRQIRSFMKEPDPEPTEPTRKGLVRTRNWLDTVVIP